MRHAIAAAAIVTAMLTFAGAAEAQFAPTVTASPGQGKTDDAFQQDDEACQAAANRQATRTQSQANNQTAGNAIMGGLLGAGIGGAFGGGKGAAIGAGAGVVGGAMQGSAQAQAAGQQRFDTVYARCMTRKGNQVDGADDGDDDN
jgi:uncharacterized protein YcfJ